MKKVLLILMLGSYSFAYASNSCAPKDFYTFLISTKGNKNIIHVDIKLDPRTCGISNDKQIMNIYWKLWEKERAGNVPCESLSKFERKFFTLKESDVEKISPNKAIVRYPDLITYGNRFGQNLSSEIVVETYKDSRGQCQTKASVTANQRSVVIDRVHTNIRGLSLRSVTFFRNSTEALILK